MSLLGSSMSVSTSLPEALPLATICRPNRTPGIDKISLGMRQFPSSNYRYGIRYSWMSPFSAVSTTTLESRSDGTSLPGSLDPGYEDETKAELHRSDTHEVKNTVEPMMVHKVVE